MHYLNLREDIDNLDWEELYPGVILYRNMLKDPDKAYRVMMDSEQTGNGEYFLRTWEPWAHFGTYTAAKDQGEQQKAKHGIRFDEEKELFDEVAISYDRAISHYFKHTGISIPEGAKYSGMSWCKYFNEIDTMLNKMTMQYHTDYIIAEKDMPGPKYHTTCTFYINDNYNGGDIEFYVNGDITNHKPKAGDIVVFPSGEPYFHGVKTIPDGNKFFIRNFVMFDYDGSPEWLQKQKEFGAYRWAKKEIERIEEEGKHNMLYIKDGQIITHDEMVHYKNMQQREQGDKNGA